MKELDGWVKIKKYTDDDGKPACSGCILRNESCPYDEWDKNKQKPGPTCPIWHGESKSEDPEDVFGVILVSGVEGHSIYINDHRICGSKPWGGGKVSKTWKATGRDIREAIGGSRTSGESKSEWQPIEMAPKDGTEVLVTGYNYGIKEQGRHIVVARWQLSWWESVTHSDDGEALGFLTHWMPLPPRPKE